MISSSTLFDSFIGRDKELRFLVETRIASGREGRGRAVLIGGEAGIGKSRLLREFERAVAKERGAFVFVRCEDLGTRPHGTLLDILRELAQIRGVRRAPFVAAAIEALNSAHAVEVDDAAELRSRRIAILRDALEDVATRLGHLTIVVDDAQWIDFGSLDGLRHAAELAKRVPLLLVVAYRDDDLDRDAARAERLSMLGRTGADRILLEPLPAAQILPSLRSVLPKTAHATLQRICELSEGKPYVAEELARSVLERPWQEEVAPTISLSGAVLARVAMLDDAARETLELAAVFGRVVRYDDLLAQGCAQGNIDRAIRAARDLQLVAETDDRGNAAFRFRHSLTREILYRELLQPQRARIHLAIAAKLEDADDERIPEYAHHLAMASDVPRSVAAFERAGDRALAVAAFEDAGDYFERAANAATDLTDVARLAHKHLDAVSSSGKHETLPESIARGRERLEGAGRQIESFELAVKALSIMANYRAGRSARFLEELRAHVPVDISPELRFEFEISSFYALFIRHSIGEAAEALARAEWALRPRSPQHMMSLLNATAFLAHRYEDVAAVETILRTTQRLAIFAGLQKNIALSNANLSVMAEDRGDFPEAIRLIREAQRGFFALGMQRRATRMHACESIYRSEVGDLATARRLIDAAPADVLNDRDWAIARMRIVRALGGSCDDLKAAALADLEGGDVAGAFRLIADLAFVAPSSDEARDLVRKALRVPLEMLDLFERFVLAVAAFGTDEDLATVATAVRAQSLREGQIYRRAHFLIFEAMVARRENRGLAALEAAREAIPLCARMGAWLPHAHALELAGQPAAARELLRSVGAVAELARFNDVAPRTAAIAPLVGLTQREEQVARFAADGRSSREIGDRLHIGRRTVETHLSNAYEKLGCHSRAELAALFATASEA